MVVVMPLRKIVGDSGDVVEVLEQVGRKADALVDDCRKLNHAKPMEKSAPALPRLLAHNFRTSRQRKAEVKTYLLHLLTAFLAY